MQSQISGITIRPDDKTRKKLKYIADSEARSMNGQIIVWMREKIKEFEVEHGEIILDDEPKQR